MRFADIAANLTDPQFTGVYHGKTKHPSDLDDVVSRARAYGVGRILITGTSLSGSRHALELAKKYDLHCTAGCHPTSTAEMDAHATGPPGYMAELRALIEQDRAGGGSKRIISVGEIGLDYDRTHFAPKETQLTHLPALLSLSKTFSLPLFLHSRTSAAHVDLLRTLRSVGWTKESGGGAVHSFTGTREEVDELVAMGLYIGINGCSLKTNENLEVVRHVPLSSLLLETDSPWCSITTTHASHSHLPSSQTFSSNSISNSNPNSNSTSSPSTTLPHPPLAKVSKPDKWKPDHGVKGRMEPCEIPLIAYVVASVKGVNVEEVAQHAWDNTQALFFPPTNGKEVVG